LFPNFLTWVPVSKVLDFFVLENGRRVFRGDSDVLRTSGEEIRMVAFNRKKVSLITLKIDA
jgi:hypothetical protein